MGNFLYFYLLDWVIIIVNVYINLSVSYADRTAQEEQNRLDFFLECLNDEDWDDLNDSTIDQRSIWRKFLDWITGLGKEASCNHDVEDDDSDDSEYDEEVHFDGN